MARLTRRKIDSLLHGEKLLLHYQPIFATRTRAIASAEALLRVADDRGNVVRGGEIAGEAEDTGEIFALQERVAWSAFHDAAQWHREGARTMRLNLNLSARQFCDASLAEKLGAMIDDSGVDAGSLNLEITETSYIDDRKTVARTLRRFADRGIQLWLDDFGTGHSSLTHLREFPVHGLKIPGEFVSGLVADSRTRTIVAAVIALAKSLEVEVVAEGVEHPAQLDALRELECDYIQGFLLSAPLTLAELIRTAAHERG